MTRPPEAKLYLVDLDDTIIRGYFNGHEVVQDFDVVQFIDKRAQRLRVLCAYGKAQCAIVTNQAGVALKHQTQEQVFRKLATVLRELRIETASAWVAFSHRDAKPVEIDYSGMARAADELCSLIQASSEPAWRKPEPEMLLEACRFHQVEPADAVMVGDMRSDQGAAEAAGITYHDHKAFFA